MNRCLAFCKTLPYHIKGEEKGISEKLLLTVAQNQKFEGMPPRGVNICILLATKNAQTIKDKNLCTNFE